MAFDKSKFIARFADEAKDHISLLNDGFLSLEKNPDDMETLNQVFRSAHTIKGASRILSLKVIAELAHKLEDALHALRDRKIRTSPELFNLLFRTIDVLGDLVTEIKSGCDSAIDTSEICDQLELATQGHQIDAAAAGESETVREVRTAKIQVDPTDEETDDTQRQSPGTTTRQPTQKVGTLSSIKAKIEETVRIPASRIDETVKMMGEIISNYSRIKQISIKLDELEKRSYRFNDLISKLEDDDRNLDPLYITLVMRQANELYTLTRSLNADTRDAFGLQSLLTDGLREKVLKMRMLPLSDAIGSFSRLVRDFSSSSGKQIDLVVEGGETEMDKKVIEKIGDPLLHMVRNAADHGIELPSDRIKAGKLPTGLITISAGYEGGTVLIEISDNGAGIPIEKIKEKALKKKLFDDETVNSLSASELTDLIFQPGFSTSSIVTDTSGRGVGMDVVRDYIIEQLQGSIQVHSVVGEGTTFTLRVPVTLAIMRILFGTIADLNIGIAINSIDEILKIPRIDIIQVVNKQAIRLREKIIPVFNLNDYLRRPTEFVSEHDEVFIVMLSLGSEKLGVMVDSLISEQDMEIMPLPAHMHTVDLIAGVTLADGDEIILLLHVPRIFELAKEHSSTRKIERTGAAEKVSHQILVVDDSINTREIEKSILESYGYRVDLAANGLEGYEKAREKKYDLIITDVEMPMMDGFSLTKKLKNETEYKHIPIIIVTSRDKEEDKRRGVEVGADAYILKGSFDQSNLLDTVQNLLD